MSTPIPISKDDAEITMVPIPQSVTELSVTTQSQLLPDEDMVYRALEWYMKSVNNFYRDVTTEIERFVLSLGSKVQRAQKKKFTEALIASALQNIEESYVVGFAIAKISAEAEQYIPEACWGVVKEYFPIVFVERGYQLGLHLDLPNTTSRELALIASSTQIVPGSLEYVKVNMCVWNLSRYQHKTIACADKNIIDIYTVTLQSSIKDKMRTVIRFFHLDGKPNPHTFCVSGIPG